MKVSIQIKGTAPLLLHKFAVEEKKSSRSKKVYLPEEEAEKACYRNEEGKIFIESQGWCTMAEIGKEEGMCEKALDAVKERLGDALQNLEQCYIGTIHSFCQRILTRFGNNDFYEIIKV